MSEEPETQMEETLQIRTLSDIFLECVDTFCGLSEMQSQSMTF